MKYFYTFLLVLALSFSLIRPQVPNAGFEDWTGTEPNEWLTNNADPYITITSSNSSHSGLLALKGECIPFVPPFVPVLAPSAICAGADYLGFPIVERFNSLKGFYKLNSQGSDNILVFVYLSVDSQVIGSGGLLLTNASSYSEFGVPITYFDPNSATPNKCTISFQMIDSVGSATLGSEMYLDDLLLSMDVVSDVEDEFQPLVFELAQNYPNPFNPSTKIRYTIPSFTQYKDEGSLVTLIVFDVLGNEVITLVNEDKPAGNYEVNFDASQLSSGIYFYKIQAGSFVETKKMLLLK